MLFLIFIIRGLFSVLNARVLSEGCDYLKQSQQMDLPIVYPLVDWYAFIETDFDFSIRYFYHRKIFSNSRLSATFNWFISSTAFSLLSFTKSSRVFFPSSWNSPYTVTYYKIRRLKSWIWHYYNFCICSPTHFWFLLKLRECVLRYRKKIVPYFTLKNRVSAAFSLRDNHWQYFVSSPKIFCRWAATCSWIGISL